MRKDIPTPKSEGVYVVVKHEVIDGDEQWSVHLLNENDFALDNILIVSTGYGKDKGKEQETSTLRQFHERLEPHSSMQIELIQPEVFHLFNEYVVTYYANGHMFDKKCIFVPDSITKDNLVNIELLGAQGVLHS